MGDHRASIVIKFDMHGHEAKTDMWINWSPQYPGGCDQRIIDFFEENSSMAMAKYHEAHYEHLENLRAKETKEKELKELDRLKAKYENNPTPISGD